MMVMTEATGARLELKTPAESGADLGEKILYLMRSNTTDRRVRSFVDGNPAHPEMRRAFLERIGRSVLIEPISDEPVAVLSINGIALVQCLKMGAIFETDEKEAPYGVDYFFWPYDGPDIAGEAEVTVTGSA